MRVLDLAGYAARMADGAVLLPSGLRLRAALLDNGDLNADDPEDGRQAKSIRIVAIHDDLFPEGLQEVQHTAGASAEEAMASGFAAWAQRTLVVLEDALRPVVRDCDLMNMKFPAGKGSTGKLPAGESEQVYQAVFGPVIRFAAPEQQPEEDEPCSFCMATRIQDALAGRLRADRYAGIRLMAGRDADGYLVADCQVNGEPLPEGVARLMAYAHAWPGRGFEIRDQYVILRPLPAASRT